MATGHGFSANRRASHTGKMDSGSAGDFPPRAFLATVVTESLIFSRPGFVLDADGGFVWILMI